MVVLSKPINENGVLGLYGGFEQTYQRKRCDCVFPDTAFRQSLRPDDPSKDIHKQSRVKVSSGQLQRLPSHVTPRTTRTSKINS